LEPVHAGDHDLDKVDTQCAERFCRIAPREVVKHFRNLEAEATSAASSI
jgi:hypothetical protein